MSGFNLQIVISVLAAGGLVFFTGTTWLYLRSFRAGIWWGLACTFLPPALPLFAILYWSKVKAPAIVSLLGALMMTAAIYYLFKSGIVDWQQVLQGYRRFEAQTEQMNMQDIQGAIRELSKAGSGL